MDYLISDIIKRLIKVQKKGYTRVTIDSLIKIASKIEEPKINCIDEVIKLIDKGIKELERVKGIEALKREGYRVSITDAQSLTGISRPTFYRWMERGIIKQSLKIDLLELKENVLHIKNKQVNTQ
jgi:DNA invertase Pin-like site-specific DNA recombinase